MSKITISKPYIEILLEDGSIGTLSFTQIFITVGIMLAIMLALYVLMGIGLMTMAKKREMKNSYLAFIPFARYYLMGKLIGKVNFFGKPLKNIGVLAVVTSACTFAVMAIYYIASYLPILSAVFKGATVTIETTTEGTYYSGFTFNSEAIKNAFNITISISSILHTIFDLVNFFVMLELFIELFKKYSPERYFLFSFVAVLTSLGGVFVFALRNKKAVDYNEYIKEKFMKMRGDYINVSRQAPPDDPFREFAKKGDYDPGDPFQEFSNKEPKEETQTVNVSNEANNQPTKEDEIKSSEENKEEVKKEETEKEKEETKE